MRWKFQDHWDKVVRLAGVARGDRHAATARISEAMSEASATIVDVHLFSGVLTVLGFELPPESARGLENALVGAGLELDEASRRALTEVATSREERVEGTLAITFPDGDPDLRRDVPAVPG